MNDSCSFPTENMLLFKLLTVSLNFFKLGGLSALNFVFLHKHFSTGKNLRGGGSCFFFFFLFFFIWTLIVKRLLSLIYQWQRGGLCYTAEWPVRTNFYHLPSDAQPFFLFTELGWSYDFVMTQIRFDCGLRSSCSRLF